MKVNDKDGNPIEIAAVVVWQVTDTAEAFFEVDDYVNYVHVQTESAVRNLAVHYTYDTHDDARAEPARHHRRGGREAPRRRSRRGSSGPAST